MPNIVEQLRKDAVEDIFSKWSFSNAWERMEDSRRDFVPEPYTPEKILDVADSLRDMMFSAHQKISNPTLSQTQSMKSQAGVVFESLITWYCNLCLAGTRSVVIKSKKSLVPEPFFDAITADYGDITESSEADLICLTFPDKKVFTEDVEKVKKSELEKLVIDNFNSFELGVISCKTPWNDFSVIPQHWDLVYSLAIDNNDALKSKGIKIGIKGKHITDFKKFFYAFVTLPSQDPKKIKAKGMPVVRLRQLSGGNYWCLPNKSNYAKSIKEIFQNFSSVTGNRNEHLIKIQEIIPKLSNEYSYFKM